MTGSRFKTLFKSRHGHKWVKHTAQELNCSLSTIMRLAIMAEIPALYERRVSEIMRKGKTP